MDSRTTAHVLSRIAALLELSGANTFKARAYDGAARALRTIDTDDLAPLLESGELARLPGVGPATLSVIRELVATGESAYLERLRSTIPEGLLELLRLPRLGGAKIDALHQALGITSLDDLEREARTGGLAGVKGFGPKTVQAILTGITKLRAPGNQMHIPVALLEAFRIRTAVAAHPGVIRAEVAGSVRRHVEVASDIDIVAGCTGDIDGIFVSFANAPGVRRATRKNADTLTITYVDGVCLDLCCVPDDRFALALWRMTGSEGHVAGISDHSQAAFYAGGLKPDQVRQQHDEIDALNAASDGTFTILKGIEADILADGGLDYEPGLLDSFDFVIGSIHSRFAMDEPAMTERVLRALDDPHLTVLAHPTGRLLLSRDPYGIDIDAVLETAAERGVAVELNADSHRLDLDWRHLRAAKKLGVTIAIGPDAHSTRGLDNTALGVMMARKGWLEPTDVLNTGDVRAVLSFARHGHSERAL